MFGYSDRRKSTFLGEKGVYLDITAIEIKNKVGESKDTHLLKQNVKKEVYDAMTEDQRNAMPILGNAINWSRQEPNAVQSQVLSESAVDSYNDNKSSEEDDAFPF